MCLGSNVHSVRCSNQIECDSFANREEYNNQKSQTLYAGNSRIHFNKSNFSLFCNMKLSIFIHMYYVYSEHGFQFKQITTMIKSGNTLIEMQFYN